VFCVDPTLSLAKEDSVHFASRFYATISGIHDIRDQLNMVTSLHPGTRAATCGAGLSSTYDAPDHAQLALSHTERSALQLPGENVPCMILKAYSWLCGAFSCDLVTG
jgi:hypothetical protein